MLPLNLGIFILIGYVSVSVFYKYDKLSQQQNTPKAAPAVNLLLLIPTPLYVGQLSRASEVSAGLDSINVFIFGANDVNRLLNLS